MQSASYYGSQCIQLKQDLVIFVPDILNLLDLTENMLLHFTVHVQCEFDMLTRPMHIGAFWRPSTKKGSFRKF